MSKVFQPKKKIENQQYDSYCVKVNIKMLEKLKIKM